MGFLLKFMVMHQHYIRHIAFLIVTMIVFCGGEVYAQYPGFDSPGVRSSGGKAVGLVPVDARVDGGSIPTGASAQVVVLFRNDGAQPVQTGKINLYPSSNISANVSLNQCIDEDLPAGAECAVAISVKGLQSGAWRLEMLMLHSGRSRLVTTTLFGTIDANGDASDRLSSDIETIPSNVDFGALATGQSVVQPVVLRNITSNTIELSDIYVNASESAGFSVKTDCTSLVAGQACLATVTWSPKQKGSATGALIVDHDGATGLTSVGLAGDYAPESSSEADIFPEAVPGFGLLVSSQEEVNFGGEVVSASTITVSLVNTGDTKLTLNEIKVSGSNNGLSVGGDGCAGGLVLEPIEACPLTLTWSPTRIGSLLDDIQILHDGARGVLILPVRGTSESTVSQDQKSIVLTKKVTHVTGGGDVVSTGNGDDDFAVDDDVSDEDDSDEDDSDDFTDMASDSVDESGSADEAATATKSKDRTKKTRRSKSRSRRVNTSSVVNAISALDGLKITSFSADRAIVNGPGGSRLVFDDEQVMLGGVIWDVLIQRNGIEFDNGEDSVLLLFDRSLSSLSRVSTSSTSSSSSNDSN